MVLRDHIAIERQFVLAVEVEAVHVDVHELEAELGVRINQRLALDMPVERAVARSGEAAVVVERAARVPGVVAEIEAEDVHQPDGVMRHAVGKQRALVIQVLPHVLPDEVDFILIRRGAPREFLQHRLEGVPVPAIIDHQPRVHHRGAAGVLDGELDVRLKADPVVTARHRKRVLHVQRAAHLDRVLRAGGRDLLDVLVLGAVKRLRSAEGAVRVRGGDLIRAPVRARVGVVRGGHVKPLARPVRVAALALLADVAMQGLRRPKLLSVLEDHQLRTVVAELVALLAEVHAHGVAEPLLVAEVVRRDRVALRLLGGRAHQARPCQHHCQCGAKHRGHLRSTSECGSIAGVLTA